MTASPSTDYSEGILSHIRILEQKLHALALGAHCNHTHSGHRSNPLPTAIIYEGLKSSFKSITDSASSLPTTSSSQAVIKVLGKLRQDIQRAKTQLERIEHLACLCTAIAACDSAFSELLNHIDSYPSLPDTAGSSSRLPLPESPEELLSARLTTTKSAVSDLSEQFAIVADDNRACVEHSRIIQTWEELMDMAMDRINGRSSSRQASLSAHSSGRTSSVSMRSAPAIAKRSKYATLTQGARALLPPVMQRRAFSNSNKTPVKTPQKPVLAGPNRAVSGPIPQSLSGSSLHKTTFASRQRTTSTTSNSPAGPSKALPAIARVERRGSAMSSSIDYGNMSTASSSSPRGTWSRAPRQSFSTFDRPHTPLNKVPQWKKKKYVANPSNKLDVAVGDVVNRLPVNIDIEVVADTWKDQSGKYWIGGDEPKLCFCRILRSQTVMVRVGGGWSELSK